MQVFKRRTRMVNFRLSDDEYQDLREMCLAHGSRSISDFARLAVCQGVNSGNSWSNGSAGKIESSVQELRTRFEELDREVKRLARLLADAPGSLPGKAATAKPLPNAPVSPPAKAATTKPLPNAPASPSGKAAPMKPAGDRGSMSKGLSREKLCATLS